jgi:hypothetical protein
MARIMVTQVSKGEPATYRVVVEDAEGSTTHEVTMAQAIAKRLGGDGDGRAIVDASFRFLLDREPKESILRRFDVSVIPRYFPDYEDRLRDYL